MESQQQVIVYSSDVAAFVDALETIGFPVVEAQADVDGGVVEEYEVIESKNIETYTIENAKILEQLEQPVQTIIEEEPRPAKRFRTNPKKQKEIIESLFDKQKAVVTEKGFMNVKGNKRFKSDVWSWFGDIKLLISRSEAKKLKIPFYFRQCGDEQMMLSKSFVGCFRCSALFIHDAQRSGTSTLRAHMRVCSRPRPRKKKGAPTIIFFPNKPNNRLLDGLVSEDDKILSHEHLLNFMLSTESSFDIIENNEFQKLLQMCISIGASYGDVNIDSMLCSQEKLSDFLLNDLYLSSINAFYTQFQNIFGASFKISIWNDEQKKQSFVSTICHYATSSGEMKNIILHTDEFNCDLKTPEDVNNWFQLFVSEMPVVPLRKLVVTDNSSNVVVAFKDEECIRCAYQNLTSVLNTVINKALQSTQTDYSDFSSLVSSCKDIVSYFDQQALHSQLPEPLKTCTEDNWCSVIKMFRLIQTQFEDILRILNEIGETHLLSVDKAMITAVIDLFNLFDIALNELKSNVEPTLNILIPWITKFRKHCIFQQDDHPLVQYLKTNLVAEVNGLLTKNITVFHRMATMLDPRFRRLAFLPREDQMVATNKLKVLIKESADSPIPENVPEVFENSVTNGSQRKDHFSELYKQNSSHESGSSEKSAYRELDSYLAEPFSISNQDTEQQAKFNPLKYWIMQSDKYPNLYRIALWLLSCPASCIQTDDVYFDNNWLVHHNRICQKSDYINKILFVKSFRNL